MASPKARALLGTCAKALREYHAVLRRERRTAATSNALSDMDRSALVPLVTDDQILDELRPPAIAWHIARRSKLAELRSLMETRFIVSVEGVSGAGKTFLVSGHLQEVRSDPLNVLWHTPITGSGLNDLFLVLEPRLGITTTEDGSRVRGLFRWLRETRSALVIDDFHRADMISFTPLIQIALAQGGPARLCLISNKRIQGDFHGLPRLLLKGFSSDETNQFSVSSPSQYLAILYEL